MGLYINLTINILDLSSVKWEQTYQESCRLLESFPVPLMRFKSEESYKHQRYMYTADVISQKGSQEEHWSVSGDLVSGQSGESFTLHRYLDQQFAYFAHPRYQENPPWEDKE